jgi:hypothetical protein
MLTTLINSLDKKPETAFSAIKAILVFDLWCFHFFFELKLSTMHHSARVDPALMRLRRAARMMQGKIRGRFPLKIRNAPSFV